MDFDPYLFLAEEAALIWVEDASGGHHVQAKIPVWMYRAWRVAVAIDGRTSQALLMDIVLEKLLRTAAIRVEDEG